MKKLVSATMASLIAAAVLHGVSASPAAAAPDNFFSYADTSALKAKKPGEVLETRTLQYRVAGIPTPVTAIQIRYRSTDAKSRAVSNITTVLKPPGAQRPNQAVAYQSFYDSLDPAHSPSRSVAGNLTFGGLINDVEAQFIVPLLTLGYPVIVADTEGQRANFAAGPEYGYNTLDSLRAAAQVNSTGITSATRIALLGYSGGAIATNWAAALAPSYAPDVNKQLIGAAEGGVLVNPARNLGYVDGSLGWAGVAAMAITGVGRSYDIDFGPYLSDYGKSIVARMQRASIAEVLFQYPGLTWRQLTKPEYADPQSVPPFVAATKKINLGSAPTPTIPMFIGQGANGILEGTDGNKPGIGAGDAVMVAGDVRALARQYCATGNRNIEYTQYDLLSHVPTMAVWAPAALIWIFDRFAGKAAPSNCGQIAPGNSLALP